MVLYTKIQEKNTALKISHVKLLFKGNESVLDFGCGDLSLARALKKHYPSLSIMGVDVVDFKVSSKDTPFIKYNGGKLPFPDSSFDVVISYHVLHHCPDPQFAFEECVRVSRKRIVVVEPIPRVSVEIPFMILLDVALNIWKDKTIPYTFRFLNLRDWLYLFEKYNLSIRNQLDVEIFPKYIPCGRSRLFELVK